jgi:DNA-binding winged helix-turn-helix (wHTH) protein
MEHIIKQRFETELGRITDRVEGEVLKNNACKLLQVIFQNPNRVITRSELIKSVWGQSYPVDVHSENLLKVHLHKVREFLRNSETLELCTVVAKRDINRGVILRTYN